MVSKKTIIEKIQRGIQHLDNYTVEEENSYCFRVSSDIDSITATLIEEIESMGYQFLHCQITGEDRKLVARFTYE